jgi:hypothetical protein
MGQPVCLLRPAQQVGLLGLSGLIVPIPFTVSEYSQRSLTYQADTRRAFLGVLDEMRGRFGLSFIHGLSEAEFDAALLWSPIGLSIR